jgi:hypothetical protein
MSHEQVVAVEVLVIRIALLNLLLHQFKRQAVQVAVVLVVTVSLKAVINQHKMVLPERQIQVVVPVVRQVVIVRRVLLVVLVL